MGSLKPLNAVQEELFGSVAAKDPEPLVVGHFVTTARQLERRGLVQVGRTDRKGESGVRLYEVSLTSAGRERARKP